MQLQVERGPDMVSGLHLLTPSRPFDPWKKQDAGENGDEPDMTWKAAQLWPVVVTGLTGFIVLYLVSSHRL